MRLFNSKKINATTFLLIFCFCGLVASCGTAERATGERGRNLGENGNPSPGEKPPDSYGNDPSVPDARPLVIPTEDGVETVRLIEKGKASWYGPKFHGKLTANGERYDMNRVTAAHRTLPFNTLVLVENIDTEKTVVVRINDRGPFAKNRIIDLSKRAAEKIGMIGSGIASVNLYVAKRALDSSESTNLKAATYTIQLGSFETESQAFDYSGKIKGSRVEIVRKNNRKVYRVYFGLYIDKEEAAKKQKELERKNFSGYIKQIENG